MQVFSGVGADMVWDFELGTIRIQRGNSVWNRANQLSNICLEMADILRLEMQLVSVLQMGYIRFVLSNADPRGITGLDATMVMFTDGTPLYPLINQLCALYPHIRVVTHTAGVDPRKVVDPPKPKSPVYTPPPTPSPVHASQTHTVSPTGEKAKWRKERARGWGLSFAGLAFAAYTGTFLEQGWMYTLMCVTIAAVLSVFGLVALRRVHDYKQVEYARGGSLTLTFTQLAKRLRLPVNKVRQQVVRLCSSGYFPGSRFDVDTDVWELPAGYLPQVPIPQKSQQIAGHAKAFVVAGAALSLSIGFVGLGIAEGVVTWEPDMILLLPVYGALFFVGLGFLVRGGQLFRLQRHYNTYRGILGSRKAVSIKELAHAAGCTKTRTRKDLRQLFFYGYFPGSTWRYEADYLLLPGGELPDEEIAPTAPEMTEEDPVSEHIQQIRQVNARIVDPEMTRKIDRMEQITVQILVIVEKYPEKRREARRFLNYYLPTTLKLLNSYADFNQQEIKTESVCCSMHNIERMLDTLLEAYERQLDQLFSAETLDISAEIQVMETMLRRDGLSDSETAILHPEKEV